jgi:uncharacterized zinc-type alcohol dehydrogenase-like protein
MQWSKTPFPFIGGHEVVGKVVELGKLVKGLEQGQRVGIGWLSSACRACHRCIRAKDEVRSRHTNLVTPLQRASRC